MYLKQTVAWVLSCLCIKEEFPNLRASALKWSSVFGSTYLCEQFFSKMNIAKSRKSSRVTDENLGMQLRVATSSVRPNIKRLVKQKNFQISHWAKTFNKLFITIHYFMLQYRINFSCMVRWVLICSFYPLYSIIEHVMIFVLFFLWTFLFSFLNRFRSMIRKLCGPLTPRNLQSGPW